MKLALVSSPTANAFMTELLAVLAAELGEQGIDARVVRGPFPELEPGLAYVVIPHEYFATMPAEAHPSPAQLRRTIALATEQPGTPWFEAADGPARACAAIADISTIGVLEWRRRGVRAEYLQLGHTAAWDPCDGELDGPRDIDILVLGSLNRRRDHYLAGYGDVFAQRETRLNIASIEPKLEGRPGVLLGAARTQLLARSAIALHVRMQRPVYFEWLRAIQTLSAGAVLVCEHSAGCAPLVAGEHFVSGSVDNLALLADALLNDPDELARRRAAGYAAMRAGPSMAGAAARLADIAQPLADAPLPGPGAGDVVHPAPAPGGRDPAMVDVSDPAVEPAPPPGGDPVRAATKRLALEVAALRRRIAVLELRDDAIDPQQLRVIATTPAYESSEPRATVAITLYDHADAIDEAIASVATQDSDEPFDLLIVDDASTDGSLHAARAALERRPWLAAQLLSRRVNAGLPRGRNELLARARAPYVLILDSDNALYPQALRRLIEALDDEPDATFAYGVMVGVRGRVPESLLSYLPWDPERLRRDNPIDAFSLLRRDAIVALGGYGEDPGLHGWEDYDLWCRVAEAGGHGIHVPNVLARYRRAEGSMLSLTDLDTSVARALIAQRSPRTMAPLAQSGA